ncbi:hypothetical protein [Streptomyces noursei]
MEQQSTTVLAQKTLFWGIFVMKHDLSCVPVGNSQYWDFLFTSSDNFLCSSMADERDAVLAEVSRLDDAWGAVALVDMCACILARVRVCMPDYPAEAMVKHNDALGEKFTKALGRREDDLAVPLIAAMDQVTPVVVGALDVENAQNPRAVSAFLRPAFEPPFATHVTALVRLTLIVHNFASFVGTELLECTEHDD